MTLPPLKPEDKKAIIVGSIIVVVSLGLFFALPFRIYYNKITKAKAALADLDKKLTEDITKKDSLLKLEAKVESVKEKIRVYEQMLPDNKEVPSLLNELYRISMISGLKFLDIEAMPLKDNTTYVEIPLKIRVFCDYHGLGRFINMVENSKRFAKVDNLTITANKIDLYRHDIDMVLSTFMFKAQSASPSPSPSQENGG